MYVKSTLCVLHVIFLSCCCKRFRINAKPNFWQKIKMSLVSYIYPFEKRKRIKTTIMIGTERVTNELVPKS